MRNQKPHSFERIGQNRSGSFIAVRKMGGIAVIYVIIVWQRLHKSLGYDQAAKTGIKNANFHIIILLLKTA